MTHVLAVVSKGIPGRMQIERKGLIHDWFFREGKVCHVGL